MIDPIHHVPFSFMIVIIEYINHMEKNKIKRTWIYLNDACLI